MKRILIPAILCLGVLFLSSSRPEYLPSQPKEQYLDTLLTLIAEQMEASADTLAAPPDGYFWADSVVVRFRSQSDTSLAAGSIYAVLEADGARVEESVEIRQAMYEHFAENPSRSISGYRVRIFFDNSQNARAESERLVGEFSSQFPDIQAYRSYTYPYFKVTVGDFRTRSQARICLDRIKGRYPSAFIVKESVSYPLLNGAADMYFDTLKVLRLIVE